MSESFYGYAPSIPANATLLAVFGVALLIHTGQGIYYRSWATMVAFGLGCLCEVIGMLGVHVPRSMALGETLNGELGYGGRIIMHSNAYDLDG